MVIFVRNNYEMIGLFKSTPTLINCIPTGYVDLHSHILPDIDDGAKTLDQTLQMLQFFKNLGVKRMCTTPHTSKYIWDNTSEIIQSKLKLVRETYSDLCEGLELTAASEYLIDDAFLDRVERKELLCINDNMVLVEFSYYNAPINMMQVFFEMQLQGYQPVLAHPERYTYLHQSLEVFEQIKKQGVILQMNLLSAVGYYGERVTQAADALLKKGLIDITSSDVHHNQHIKAFDHKLKIKNQTQLKEAIQRNGLL